jgi:5'-AMP-activated protein kinase catalytic alpha subunit
MVGYNRIPIDTKVLKELKGLEFDIDHAQKSIEANRHNSVTTSYYLLLKKNLKDGFESEADIGSVAFDTSLLVPQKRRERLKTLPP